MNVKLEIINFIKQNELSGALLLTGEWGSGKSFLVKEIAKELNSSKTAAIAVISLFGINTIADLNRRVKEEYSLLIFGQSGRNTAKYLKAATKVVKEGFNVAETATSNDVVISAASKGISSILSFDILSFINIQNTIGSKEHKRPFVLIFDDLERCGIPDQKDILGAINEYLENKSIKVIIVADEKKISDKDFEEYKEKLIGRTISMSANYSQLIDGILSMYSESETGYKEFLIDNAEIVKRLFYESQSNNIRTLKCVLSDFERFYGVWYKSDLPKDNAKWALYTFGAELFETRVKKQGEQKTDRTNPFQLFDGRQNQFPDKGKNQTYLSSFSTWIHNGEWDETFFLNELRLRYSTPEISPETRFLQFPFWDMEQKDIEDGLPIVIKKAYDGDLTCDELITLLQKIYYLKYNKIEIPVTVDYKKMHDGFVNRCGRIKSGLIDEPERHSFTEMDQIDAEALPLYKDIEHLEDKKTAWHNRRKFIKYLSEDAYNSSIIRGIYLDCFDDQLLNTFISVFSSSPNGKKRELALTLLKICFTDPNYSSEDDVNITKNSFCMLKNQLRTSKEKDQISELIIKSFISEIDNLSIFDEQ